MVRLIMGANGAGKTKQLIDLIHSAVESENGSVVCIEPGADMTFDIKSSVRLVNGKEYNLNSFECLRGFISGLYAGNYDISHVFVDNLSKVVGSNSLPDVEELPALAGPLQRGKQCEVHRDPQHGRGHRHRGYAQLPVIFFGYAYIKCTALLRRAFQRVKKASQSLPPPGRGVNDFPDKCKFSS